MAVINLRNIDDGLRNQFKAACAAKGKTITEELVRLMKEVVEKYEKEKRK
jgi:plasmid stability protein